MLIEAKIKKLRLMGGHIAPKSAEIFSHLLEQSQKQACEGLLISDNFTELKKQIKALEKKHPPLTYEQFRNLLIMAWGIILTIMVAVYYGQTR